MYAQILCYNKLVCRLCFFSFDGKCQQHGRNYLLAIYLIVHTCVKTAKLRVCVFLYFYFPAFVWINMQAETSKNLRLLLKKSNYRQNIFLFILESIGPLLGLFLLYEGSNLCEDTSSNKKTDRTSNYFLLLQKVLIRYLCTVS